MFAESSEFHLTLSRMHGLWNAFFPTRNTQKSETFQMKSGNVVYIALKKHEFMPESGNFDTGL